MLRFTLDEVQGFIERLEAIPGEMEEISIAKWETGVSIKQLRMETEEFKWSCDFEVRCSEDAKKKYSNEAAREAAIRQLMSVDEGCQRRKKEIDELESHLESLNRRWWKLKDEAGLLGKKITISVSVWNGLSCPITKKVMNGQAKPSDNF